MSSKLTKFLPALIILLSLFFFPFPARAITSNSCATPSETAVGNLHVLFEQTGTACDEWDYTQCDENCQKWVAQARITCVDHQSLVAAIEGNPQVFEELMRQQGNFTLSGLGNMQQGISKTSSFGLDNEKASQLSESANKVVQSWARWNTRKAATSTSPTDSQPSILYSFWQGNYKDKIYWPESQVTDIADRCLQILRTVEDPSYPNQDIYAENPSPVYDSGPTNYQACLELRNSAPQILELQEGYMDAWYQLDPTLRNQLMAITETKSKIRAFLVVAKDPDLNERCDGIFCFIARLVNPQLRQQSVQQVFVVDFFFEGARGVADSLREFMDHTLLLPNQADELWQRTAYFEGNYEPVCPDNCFIEKQACEALSQNPNISSSQAQFYQRLVNKICSENQTCDSVSRVAIQFSGGTSAANPSIPLINAPFSFSLTFDPKIGIPLQKQPTTRAWVIIDASGPYFLQQYSDAFYDIFRYPNEIDSERPQILADHPLETDGQASTEIVYAVPSPLPPCEGENCPEEPPAQSASIEYELDNPDLKFYSHGGTEIEVYHQITGKKFLPLWSQSRFYCTATALAGEFLNRFPSIARILDVPPGETCPEAL